MKILSFRNKKTQLSQKHGYLTASLSLAPWAPINLSNDHPNKQKTTCPMALLAGCKDPCVGHNGSNRYPNAKLAKAGRTSVFESQLPQFISWLHADLEELQYKADKSGLQPACRMNNYSDILWELYNFMGSYPAIQFYDYTKIFGRTTPSNYDITFSYSDKPEFRNYAMKAVNSGMRISAVFNKELPKEFLGRQVVNGDEHDLTFLHPTDVVVGLLAKGKARNLRNGFVNYT